MKKLTKTQRAGFDTYQEGTNLTVSESVQGDVIYFALGLGSEAGEVVDIIKKAIRDSGGEFDAISMVKELGDVLFYVAQLAECVGVNLSDVAQMNRDKLASRLERGVIGGSGDER